MVHYMLNPANPYALPAGGAFAAHFPDFAILPPSLNRQRRPERLNMHLDSIEFSLNATVAIIMLGMGLSLTINDFRRIAKEPRSVLLGLFNQLILLPILALGLAFALKLDGQYAVGLMLLAACPGGATSNLISNLAKGDVGLSVTLTAISSMITVLTIPFIVNMALMQFMSTRTVIQLPYLSIFLKILLITVVPVILGMIIRKHREAFAGRMEKPVKIASALLMATIIIGAVALNKGRLASALPAIGPAVLGLNILTMLAGFLSGKLLRLQLRQRVSISIECGIQNASLALAVVGMGLAQYTEIALVPATYGVLMFATGGAFAAIYAAMVTKSAPENEKIL